jgi:prevent-host-death family protein
MMFVDVHDAGSQLSRLVDRALAGEEIVIAKAGRPLARLVPYEQKPPRRPGRWRNQGRVAPDFDETPNDVLDAFEGR